MKQKKSQLVYVAMSGGVDSSVAAALLKEQGFQVVGVFMKPWQDDTIECLWKQDREDALRAAAVLDIPLLTWDFSKEYGKKVTRYMIDSYKKGITPNPDVMCNKEIKFGLFLKKALKEGADYIATGHYARIKREFPISNSQFPNKNLKNVNCKLKIARDSAKDQTYFLWTLTNDQLSRTLFPIGEYEKPNVRKLAQKFALPNHAKKDSQGVCFVGELDMKDFLMNHIKPKPGKVVHVDGRELGIHDGVYYYTIGQRHGLDLGIAGGPYYVISKNVKKNIVVVGSDKDLLTNSAQVKNIHWIHGNGTLPKNLGVKIRYRSETVPATLDEKGNLTFKKPVRAITPGQSAVFYRGSELLGGAIIK